MITKTSNFYLAAGLIASGVHLLTIDSTDKKHLRFVFDDIRIAAIEKAWDEYSLEVNARSYAEAIRDIKLKIHQIIGE